MMLKKSLFIVVILLLATMTALAQESIAVGDSVTASGSGTELEYVLDASEGDELVIDAVSEDFDTYLRILDAEGETVTFDDDSGDRLNAQVIFTVPADGSYTIVITEAYGDELTGDVSLSVMDAADMPTEEPFEPTPVPRPDSDGATGTSLEAGQTAEGTFSGTELEYTFNATVGETYTISLTSDDFDTILELYDSEDNFITDNDDGGSDTNSLITFSPDYDDTYTVIVRSFGSGQGDFMLALDTIETISLTVGEPFVVEAGATGGIFTFEGEAGMMLDVYAVSEGQDDTYLSVLDPSGYEVDYDDQSGVGSNPYIRAVTLPEDGSYRLELSSYSGELADDLTLYLEPSEPLAIGPDPVTYAVADGSEDEYVSFEVDDDSVYRLVIEINEAEETYLYGVIYQPDDEDTYFGSSTFNISDSPRAAIDIIAVADGTMRVELDLSLYDNDEDIEVTISVTDVTEAE